MQTSTITVEQAEQLLAQDLDALRSDVLSANLAPGECVVLVDGSMYSPSWRAFPHGEEVYAAALNEPALPFVSSERYDAYDVWSDGTRDFDAPHDHAIYWEDGCLFLARAGDDGEFASE